MDKSNLEQLAAAYLKYDDAAKAAKAKRDAKKAAIIATLDAFGVDELTIGNYTIRRTATTAQVFDSKAFAKEHPKYHAQYKKPQTRNHFTVIENK